MTGPELLAAARAGTVIIAGAGVSGAGIAGILADAGAAGLVIADDDLARGTALAGAHGARAVDVAGAIAMLGSAALVAASPGWRPDAPLFAAAAAAGVPVTGEVALARAADAAGVWGPPRTWLAVTGTNGKTTTTGMLAAMLGDRGAAVGNIGVALHDALTAKPRVAVLAAELSSFQLHRAPGLAPEAGALLNLAEDHIDWHGGFEAYAMAKAAALTGAVAVYGADDPKVRAVVDRLRAEGRLAPTAVGFTAGEPAPGQVGVAEGRILDRAFAGDPAGLPLAEVAGISPPGLPGVLDAVAAAALARAAGAAPADIARGLAGFTVAAHRGQLVHRSRGGAVAWYDDSKATNPHAADAAMTGVPDFTWVGGGQLKGADIRPLLARHAGRMEAAVLLGADAPVIAAALAEARPGLPVTVIEDTDPRSAMTAAVRAAAAHATSRVLLAPAAASLDMFEGMAQRGDLFAEAARALDGAAAPGEGESP